tara:strand:+ start:3222 stop:3821 length:600 start_codon:yes stop_codon:yes gene_type:complete
MAKFEKQYNLFNKHEIDFSLNDTIQETYLEKTVILQWQRNIIDYQSKLFRNEYQNLNQSSLFESNSKELFEIFNPLELTPLPMSFWRWPNSNHTGAAIYFVIDKMMNHKENIVLYIGETLSADKRWKGAHDCKSYLANYSEKLQKANLSDNLSIRFWFDVPRDTKKRRELEQKLIQTWLPPFNKETRGYWSTPFTSQIN